jgi:hypothetical protein
LKRLENNFQEDVSKMKIYETPAGANDTVNQGLCDSDYAGDQDTRKSVTGYAIYVLGCMVAWKSKSQRSVALSSSEAEYISILEITKDILL